MSKSILPAVAGVLALATVATSADAGSRTGCWNCGPDVGGAAAAGIVGGLAAGALVGGAARPAYGAPAYYGPPATVYDEEECYYVRRRFVDDWGRVVIRRTRVCE